MLSTALRAVVAACALATTAANARPGLERVMERVGQADLDLGSIAGRAKLEQRLRWAATRVCSDYERPAPAGRLVDSRCFRATMKSAVQQMDQAIANQASKRKIGVASIKE